MHVHARVCVYVRARRWGVGTCASGAGETLIKLSDGAAD